MAQSLTDKNRRDPNFNVPQVETVLPEHFKESYPTLVTFIKKFYEYLETAAGANVFHEIFYIRDAESTNENYLDYLFFESINGLGSGFFDFPRLSLKLIPNFYPVKGTEVSVTGFFRYIYGVEAETFYPKTQIFKLNESFIGAESLRFIQDSNFYQILSIQIKSPLGITRWRDIYKKYNHPAGFALFAETRFEGIANNSIVTAPISIQDSAAQELTIEDLNIATTTAFTSITSIDDSARRRMNVGLGFNIYNEKEHYAEADLEDSAILNNTLYNGQYISIADILNPDSRRFSDSDDNTEINYNMSDSSEITLDEDSGSIDVISPVPGITFSATTETMDEDQFQYQSDSGLDSA